MILSLQDAIANRLDEREEQIITDEINEYNAGLSEASEEES